MTADGISGKAAIVTGGGSGIGAATARAISLAGAEVAVVDIDGDSAEQVVRAIEAEGGRRSQWCVMSETRRARKAPLRRRSGRSVGLTSL